MRHPVTRVRHRVTYVRHRVTRVRHRVTRVRHRVTYHCHPDALNNKRIVRYILQVLGDIGASPGDKGASPGDKGASPGDKGASPGDKGASPGDIRASPSPLKIQLKFVAKISPPEYILANPLNPPAVHIPLLWLAYFWVPAFEAGRLRRPAGFYSHQFLPLFL